MAYGIANGMKVRIDKAGRIVVPKPLRERLGFKPDTELEAIEQPEGVLLKRVVQRPSMVRVDGLWVHQGSAELTANWERVLEEAREERIEVRFESVARWKFSSITTVLVAASEQSHPHYAQAKPAMLRVAAGQERDLLACTRSRRCLPRAGGTPIRALHRRLQRLGVVGGMMRLGTSRRGDFFGKIGRGQGAKIFHVEGVDAITSRLLRAAQVNRVVNPASGPTADGTMANDFLILLRG